MESADLTGHAAGELVVAGGMIVVGVGDGEGEGGGKNRPTEDGGETHVGDWAFAKNVKKRERRWRKARRYTGGGPGGAGDNGETARRERKRGETARLLTGLGA